jgi:hypothetical protein
MTVGAGRPGVLAVAAVAEAATGLALLAAPGLVVRLLLGVELAGAGVPVARVAGIALVGLGLACWPGPPRIGMLAYGAGVALYLGYLGVIGPGVGLLQWPAVAVHALLTLALLLRRG